MPLFILFFLPGLVVIILFIRYLITGINAFKNNKLFFLDVLSIIVMPFVFISFFDINEKNNCCTDSAVFSPQHRFSIYLVIITCIVFYFYAKFRKTIAPPIVEIIINSFLVAGVVLNIFIAIQIDDWLFWLPGNVPIVILFLLMLVKNHELFLDTCYDPINDTQNEKLAWQILRLKLFQKIPILLIVFVPFLFVFIGFLLLFGQKPDSIVKAFTDTYKHGFSQLDYQCADVVCGGHYLCTIAAKGHPGLVKPVRTGVRGQHKIICNRQLLISNAFEELMEKNIPFIHKPIRRFYDLIGFYVQRYYGVFNNKFVSDFVYILMKPLEWFFLLVLYTFDKKPESRIATQYLSKMERQLIKSQQPQNV